MPFEHAPREAALPRFSGSFTECRVARKLDGSA
jgi:hypothetical protein